MNQKDHTVTPAPADAGAASHAPRDPARLPAALDLDRVAQRLRDMKSVLASLAPYPGND
jgi:hypothetical protein